MREPSISKPMLDTLSYFAQGHIVYSDSVPIGLPNPELFPLLVERKLVVEIDINPNDLYIYKDKIRRRSYFAISPKGKELYFLEKELRDERAKQDVQSSSQHMQAVKDQKHELRHDYFVAAFSELISSWFPHLAPKLIDFVKALFKSLAGH